MNEEGREYGRGDAAIREHLTRIAEGNGVLLRVQRQPCTGPAGARLSERVRMIFDVAAFDLWVDQGELVAGATDERTPLLSADEDEPWWTLLGHPLTRVAAHDAGGSLVQFRADDASPKILVLAAEGDAISVHALV